MVVNKTCIKTDFVSANSLDSGLHSVKMIQVLWSSRWQKLYQNNLVSANSQVRIRNHNAPSARQCFRQHGAHIRFGFRCSRLPCLQGRSETKNLLVSWNWKGVEKLGFLFLKPGGKIPVAVRGHQRRCKQLGRKMEVPCWVEFSSTDEAIIERLKGIMTAKL